MRVDAGGHRHAGDREGPELTAGLTVPESPQGGQQDGREGDGPDGVVAEVEVPEADGQEAGSQQAQGIGPRIGERPRMGAEEVSHRPESQGQGQDADQRRSQSQREQAAGACASRGIDPEKGKEEGLPVGVQRLPTAVGREEDLPSTLQHPDGVYGVVGLIELEARWHGVELVQSQGCAHQQDQAQ